MRASVSGDGCLQSPVSAYGNADPRWGPLETWLSSGGPTALDAADTAAAMTGLAGADQTVDDIENPVNGRVDLELTVYAV